MATKKIENRFNLVEENWIPFAERGLVSLKQIFSSSKLKALGGNPVQKIALTKLLLAICQTAWTPRDDKEWKTIGARGMAKKALAYLEDKKECFWLYGEKPFLQMPGIKKAKIQPYGAVLSSVATGNTTILLQSHVEQKLSDAEIAQLIVQLMGFALGGKKTDNSVVLSKGYSDKSKAGKSGPSLGFLGYLHSFLNGSCILETLWLNLFSYENIHSMGIFSTGLGEAPWENMPKGENCPKARKLKKSLLGRFIPLSRFVLAEKEDGLHYSEGIAHPTHKEGGFDPSIAVDFSGKNGKALWVDPEKRPWRYLTSLLSFIETEKTNGFICHQLKFGIIRSRKFISKFGIWSGGLRVSSNAGEQYVSGSDDYVESLIFVNSPDIGKAWFSLLKQEITVLEELSKIVYGRVVNFYKDQNAERDGENMAKQASSLFWQLCERRFQLLVDACVDETEKKTKAMRPAFTACVNKSYNTFCPHETARQLDAWAKNRPNLRRYLKA